MSQQSTVTVRRPPADGRRLRRISSAGWRGGQERGSTAGERGRPGPRHREPGPAGRSGASRSPLAGGPLGPVRAGAGPLRGRLRRRDEAHQVVGCQAQRVRQAPGCAPLRALPAPLQGLQGAHADLGPLGQRLLGQPGAQPVPAQQRSEGASRRRRRAPVPAGRLRRPRSARPSSRPPPAILRPMDSGARLAVLAATGRGVRRGVSHAPDGAASPPECGQEAELAGKSGGSAWSGPAAARRLRVRPAGPASDEPEDGA